MQTFDVIVVGGALVGASFALALRSADLSVALVEPHLPSAPADDGSWDSRVYAISPGNAAWLRELGVWSQLSPDRLCRVESMKIFGDRRSAELDFNAYDAGLRELAWIAEYRLLHRAAWGAVASLAHVTLFSPSKCQALAWERASGVLTLDDGQVLEGRMIVGADGADSWVRSCAAIAATTHEYHQIGVVANFENTRRHDDTAFQWFRHDGVLALLPLPGERVSMVWSAPEARARELLQLDGEALAREVEEASTGAVGGLRVLTQATGFPLKRQHVARLVGPRVALIGDAAHNIHPLAGQGVNLGLRDARELSAVLTDRGPQPDCGDYNLLRRYERARREDIAALEATTDGLEKLFSNRAVWIAELRNLGLSLVNAQPPLKNTLVKHAAA
jgi:2-polyprenylphenol 6-hydroxylase